MAYIHAGNTLEPVPRGQQSNFRGNPAWFDFGASCVPTCVEGYCEVKSAGLRHVAVRTCGRESKYRPQVKNIAPRAKDWRPSPSATAAAKQ